MTGAHCVLFLCAGDVHCAIETEAAVHALEKGCTPITPVLVLPAAAHSVLGHSARRNLHLVHFFSAFGATEALCEVVLRSCKGAVFTFPAVCVQPRAGTVLVQVGPFVALRTANGIILRVNIFSLGTQNSSLLPVPDVRDQCHNP